jgi:POT family proton-dependent oligopeptide transporter
MAVVRQRSPRPRYPAGFYVICLVVACERWAAYTLASSVVLMLCDRYGYARADALRLAGLVNAASYLGTLPGGLLADRILCSRRALSISTMLLALGYLVLIFASPLALCISLLLLVIGSALFRPSTQALIVRLYRPGDTRLDAAQVWFYMAVNAGAAMGALIAGLVVRHGGWSAAFAVAAAMMVGSRLLLAGSQDALQVRASAQKARQARPPETRTLRPGQRAMAVGALMLAMLLYTVCYGQVEGSLLLWAHDRTDRVLLGFEVPATWFVALPALLVLLLGPAQLAFLEPLQRRIGTYRLVAAGLISVALAFVVMIPATLAGDARRVSMTWLVACLTLMVLGELLVAPLGISVLLRLAPPRFVGVLVGGWYLSVALGYWLAGEVAALWACWSPLGVLAFLAALPLVGAALLWRAKPC